MQDFYKGYIITNGKRATSCFKDVSSKDLLTLDEVKMYPSYAGILADDAILIDVDTEEETSILLNIVKSLNLKCRVLKSRGGGHFLFKINQPMSNRTKVTLAIGISADIKGCGRASYEVLKIDGTEREVLYDSGDYQNLPKYLFPIKTNAKLINLSNGEGRNNALFSYILPLQQNDFSIEECRECIKIINEFVLKEPLSESELSVILRDAAFNKPVFFSSRGTFHFDAFARHLVDNKHVVRYGGALHVYKDGYYQKGDECIEYAMIEEIPTLNQNKRKEVLSYLNLIAPKISTLADAHLVAFKNGVLNVITNELMDFSPNYFITNKIPHNYVPNSTNALLDTTMRKLACQDEQIVQLLYQAVGYSMYRRNELRKSFFMIGDKRNGKSTFFDMINTLLGEDNIANLDLSEIGHEFKTAELLGKLANIGDDINDEYISNSAIFKKVVSGDKITVAKKHKDPFVLTSYAKFFFSANSLPRLGRGRDSEAVIDRLVIIPFDATFSKTDPDYDPYVKYKLRDESVMEALIIKAVEGLREVLAEQTFVTCDKVSKNIVEYERVNNPILVFFEEMDESEYLNQPTKDVYRNYSVYCLENNLQPVASNEFSKQIKKHLQLEVKELTIDKKRVRVYKRGE